MTDSSFMPTPANMVREVYNIVEGYQCGANRALAQDPPQNSLDAHVRRPVAMRYVLHRRRVNGDPMVMLSITDENTTGLRGPALSQADLEERAERTGYLELARDENWAAWEAMGYTKEGEDDLGSRGQGKAAFLFHSAHPSGYTAAGRPLERMIILYDTLLEDGTYRLGVRIARPDDVRLEPPFENEAAREIVRTGWSGGGYDIPLDLEPLETVGARIIVPFLRPETVEAFESGEIRRWLERTWWRAIQCELLTITVAEEGEEPEAVGVPDWWSEEPWSNGDDRAFVKESIPVERDSRLKIKRIVLYYDEELAADEIISDRPEYSGVQMLRGSQWIETLGAKEQYGDLIPPDKRPGFRGFVEFERQLDRNLREMEFPQHDRFDRRYPLVRLIDARVEEQVEGFARDRGWYSPDVEPAEADETAESILTELAELFVSPSRGAGIVRPGGVKWKANLEVTYPNPNTTRVDWGHTLTGIEADVEHEPADRRLEVAARLQLIDPDGGVSEIETRNRRTSGGRATVDFADIAVERVARSSSGLAFPDEGRYRIRVVWEADGKVVARASRAIYVRKEPPGPASREFSIDLEIANLDADRVRVNDGERIRIDLGITNRTDQDADLAVYGSLGGFEPWDDAPISLPGRPPGDVPWREPLSCEVRVFAAEPAEKPTEAYVVLEPGRHLVRVDVKREGSKGAVAHASRPVFVETDPGRGGPRLPYEPVAWNDRNPRFPVWRLEPPLEVAGMWILKWSRYHPVYLAAETADGSRPRRAGRLHGVAGFWIRTHCEALVELALSEYRDRGDQGPFLLLVAGSERTGSAAWTHFEGLVEQLMHDYADPIRCATLQREVSNAMVRVWDLEDH